MSKLQRARQAATKARKVAKSDATMQAGATIAGGAVAPALDGRLGEIAGIEPATIVGVAALALGAFGPKKLRAAALGFGSGLLAVQASETTSAMKMLTGGAE